MTSINDLKKAILTKDKEQVLTALTELREDVIINESSMAELTTPECITELHQMLVDNLGVNQKLMRLRNKVPNRRHRAMLFCQAMTNGVNYLK